MQGGCNVVEEALVGEFPGESGVFFKLFESLRTLCTTTPWVGKVVNGDIYLMSGTNGHAYKSNEVNQGGYGGHQS